MLLLAIAKPTAIQNQHSDGDAVEVLEQYWMTTMRKKQLPSDQSILANEILTIEAFSCKYTFYLDNKR